MRRLAVGDERGAVAVAGVLLTLALVLLVEVSLDTARAFLVRSELTAIADDAALAGAGALDLDAWRQGRLALDPAAARAAAEAELAANPTVSGSVTAEPSAISVSVSEAVPTVALRLAGISEIDVTAAARARPETP